MKQLTLAAVGFERYAKTTRRAVFLTEMERVVPWPALRAGYPWCRASSQPQKVRFAPDSALEGDGFELPVPHEVVATLSLTALSFGTRAHFVQGNDPKDRRFESRFLQRRVYCEPDFL